VWELEARYLAFGLLCIAEVLSPQRIVVGGGVASQSHLFDRMRRHLVGLNNGYIARPALGDGVSDYVVPPGLGGEAGVMGALELARMAYESGG
jgi:fructokinase